VPFQRIRSRLGQMIAGLAPAAPLQLTVEVRDGNVFASC
jgi:hypothetical protein